MGSSLQGFLRKLLYAGQAFNLREGQENMFRRLSSKGAVAFAGVTLLSAVLLTGCGGDSEDSKDSEDSAATVAATSILACGTLVDCSSDGRSSAADFCESGKNTFSGMEIDATSSDFDADKIIKEINAISPPAEIKSDWNIVKEAAVDLLNEVKDIDLSDPSKLDADAIQKITDASSKMSSESVEAASEKVQKYVDENCE